MLVMSSLGFGIECHPTRYGSCNNKIKKRGGEAGDITISQRSDRTILLENKKVGFTGYIGGVMRFSS